MISVVVPIFNEEENIFPFHQAIANALDTTHEEWEVVYVNDGSRDSSLSLLQELQANDPHVVVADLSRNWGHMGAISAGLKVASGDAVVLMDGDFQDPPEVVPQLIQAWKDGAQVVTAVRRSRQESRKVLALLFPMFYRVLGALSDYPIPLNAGIFGLMDRQAVDSMNSMGEINRYLPGIRAWVGYKTGVVYYDRHDRAAGEGKLSFISRIKYAMDAITSFSYKPLRLCFLMSAISCLTVFVLGLLAIFSKNQIDAVGFGVTSAIFLLGSFMFLCLGVLGEYLGRVHDEVRRRPLSIINKIYTSDALAVEGELSFEEEFSDKIARVA
ncbi:glycosyltransferase family 2 protein [Acidobacterium sp. S8]|uniref:glycosyltransferase family 2 protein n=1 Tax=Acidobacterium sp. S8 TaxID=1641854 RepID=UPI00131EAEEB|nr:glycosyltransferase family 2 protein [Acidobacterium sp. S8]